MPSPEELVGQFFKRFDDIDKPSGYVTLPYISGITDALRRILRKQNIRVATKPLKTLQTMFPSPKLQIAPEQRTNVVYIIIYLALIVLGRMLVKQEHLSKREKRNILEV